MYLSLNGTGLKIMDNRQIIVILCLFGVFFSALSFASASDALGNETLSVSMMEEAENTITLSSSEETALEAPSQSFDDLKDTIQDSSVPEGGTVTLENDYSYESGDVATGIDIEKDLTIDGKGFTINANQKAAIFNVVGSTHVTLINITFIGGNSTNGGAINVVSGGSVDVIDCTFINNTAANQGGAIYIADNVPTAITSKITRSTFENNGAVSGGAVYVNGSSLNISSSEFSKDVADSYGGSVFIDGVLHITQTTFDYERAGAGGAVYLSDTFQIYSTIEKSTFTNSYVTGDGGAVFVSADNVHMKDLKFIDNTAGDDGGAIYWEGSTGVIDNITCIGNKGISLDKAGGDTSSTRGGTICLTGSDVIITHSQFSNSSAYMDESKDYSKVDGGALFITGNNVVVNDTTFDSCNATNNGAGVYIIGNDTHIYNCDFNNCFGRDGGAVYVQGEDCSLYNTTFTHNKAGDDGGAIYWEGNDGYIYNITCIDNKGISSYDPLDGKYSNSKGGTICLTGSDVIIDVSTFSRSSAKVDGGALFITGNDVRVLHSNFTDCISTNSSGGAVYIIGNETHIIDCEFSNCNVDPAGDHRGGAIFVAGNDANITKSTFSHTKALIGGAIFIEGDDTIVDDSTFEYNDAVYSTGGTGGAINVNGERAVITNSDFSHGTAVNYGGAIAIWGSDAFVENNTFTLSKTTKFNGGAVFINGVHTTISLSNFSQCSALGDQFARGGAIDVMGDDAHITGCNFDDCDARIGGVIYVSGTDANIEKSTFQNSEAREGGAIYVDGINTSISHSNFTDISADNYGGSIYVAGANANISESNFVRSKVKNYYGGSIYISGENTNIEKSNFTSSEALNTRNKAVGGAIYISGSNAVVNQSNFDDCKASEGGGAIYSYGNFATIEDSTFNASSAKYGGSIYLTSWGSIVKGSNITGSIATENGGGIYVAEGSIQIAECNFDECIAKGTSQSNGGGAIYINGPDTHITASNFTNNNVPGSSARGGSIFIKGERTIIDDSEFVAGMASQGGEIFIEGANAVIDTSSFANSSSRYAGGSIYVKGDEATIRDSTFDNISAKSDGGAIYVDGGQTDILSSSFYNCTVDMNKRGGAIFIANVGTTVDHSNFTLSRGGTGGAIFIEGKNTIISYCNLNNNTANSAGAIKVYGDDTYISNSNFTYNYALTQSGGALDIGGSNASVFYSWFDHNDAMLDGGAINWLGGHGDDSIIGSTFTNNIAHDTQKGGGAIYWTQGNVIAAGGIIKDSIFINNTAAGRHGGAIDWFHALDSVIDNCLFVNNTSKSDGGALYTGDQGGKSKNLTITNSQFYNNTAGLYGGAIANQMANSYVYNNTFDGNKAMAGGGTILMKEGPADNCIIDHCYIYNSQVGDVNGGYGEGGGAILLGVSGDDNITISNCAILNTTIGHGPGGAISIQGKYCSIINVSIEDSSTKNDVGGAVHLKGSNTYMNNVTIFNSSSNSLNGDKSSDGGAIYVSGWYCELDDIKIFKSSANNDEECKKTNYGGAIYVSGSTDVLTNIVIDDSNSTNAKMNAGGGAIFYEGLKGTLVNVSISNTLATGNGGAIYWKGGSPANIENISITYSKTEVTNSTNTADGGAIYATTVAQLNNVHIEGAHAHKDSGDVHGGAIFLRNGQTLNNVTVVGSRATTDNGTSYGGAIYSERTTGSTSLGVYNSTFEENNADLGGGIYFNKITGRIFDSSFTGNVANRDGGAVYGIGGDILTYTSTFDHNSAKRGGAIFAENVHIQMEDSTLEFNTAEEKGGAIYYNYNNKAGNSIILRCDIVNNTAFQGSAMYGTKFNKMSLRDTVLLDNQANSNKFTDKAVGVDEEGNNYTSAVFLGFDNLLNAIWQEGNVALACTNVTYWGVNGRTRTSSPPTQSDREVNINVTVEMYDENGVQLNTEDLVTDENGKVTYNFDAEDGKTYYFAYVHKSDRYYTYLRDTLSNSSLVKIYVYNPIFYNQNQTILIQLTDGAWGNLNGTVIVTFNDSAHTTFEIEVKNGTGNKTGISNLPIGHYNATATFRGDANHTGDTDWTVFEVVPYDDLQITKDVNVTADYVNVTDIIKYTITVKNNGPSDGYGVNVTERLSPYLKLINSKATKGTYNLEGGYWYIGELDVDDFETLTIIAQVIHMGPITNTVWVTGLGNDTNMSNNVASAHNFTAVPITDLSITKNVNVTKDTVNVLDKIKFTITVKNNGPCDATGVIVEELLDDHLKMISNTASAGTYKDGTWNIGNLANGKTATLTIVSQVIYSGTISNKVHVSGYENESNYTNNYAEIKNLTAVANVDLQINKYVNVSGTVNVSDIIRFTVTVTNNGPCNATGVYVGETLSPHLKMLSNKTTIGVYDGTTWIIGNLNKGEIHNLTIIAEVISAGTISNVVVIYGNDNDTNTSNNRDEIPNITAVNVVDLEVHKKVDVTSSFVYVGDRIAFTVTVKNNGPCDATNVQVAEKLSPHLRMIDYSTWGSTYDVNAGIWDIGNLAKGDYRDLIIWCEVVSSGNISNVVVATSTENDTNKSNNRDEIPNITAKDIVDLQITKECNFTGDLINVTDYIKYTVTLFNDGPSNATEVYVSEALSPHLKLVRYETDYGYYNVTGGYWYVGRLNNQSTAVLTIYAQVISNGTIANVVIANSKEEDSNYTNNRAEVKNITSQYIVDLQIKKEVSPDVTDIDITVPITFTITVYNAGPCNATGVYVSEPLSDILVPTSITASKGSYDGYTWVIDELKSGETATLTITANSAYSGVIENEVYVTSREIDTNTSNNKDNITPIRVSAQIDLSVTKTVANPVVNVSDWVEFTIVAHNKGPSNASGVYVAEILDAHLGDYTYVATEGTTYDGYTWYIGKLEAGADAILKIRAQAISKGNFSNYVEIFGYGNDTNPYNNNATVNVTAKPVVDLIITKDVNVEADVVDFGDTIIFTVTVRNNGPCDATNVNVTEVLDSHLKLLSYVTSDGSIYDVSEGVWHIGDFAKISMKQLIITAQVISVGNISNVVYVTSTENDTNKSNNHDEIPNITAVPIADLEIKKEINVTSKQIYVLDEIKFTITVTNNGPCNATNVNVSEVLNPHLKLIKNETDTGDYDADEGVWHIGNMTNKTTAVLTIYAQVISPGTIENVVVVNGTEKDSNPYNNRDEIANITASLLFDLQITKEVNVTTVNVGVSDIIKFTVTAYNAGPCYATGVYVSEPLSDRLSIISNITTKGTYDGYTWNIGNLNSGETANLTIVARIAYSGIIENVVIITGDGVDTNTSNNRDEITPLNATTQVDLAITKNVTASVVNVGDWIEFTVTATNNAKYNATGVYVLEALDFTHLGRDYIYETSEGTTYNGYTWNIGNLNAGATATLKIVAHVITQGNFSNYVEIFGYDPDTNESNNNATVNITANPVVDLSITKDVYVDSSFDPDNNGSVVYYGDEIRFVITVSNNGPCDATNVNVTEKLNPCLTLIGNETGKGYYDAEEGIWYIGDLAAGEWCELVLHTNVTAVGNITNVVCVTSTENDTNKSNNNASIPNITSKPLVDLMINKTVNVTGIEVNVTDIIKFTVTVTNNGPCNATNVYVREPLSDKLRLIGVNATKGFYIDNYTWVIGNMTSGSTETLTLIARIVYSGDIENAVYVTSNDNDTDPSNNEDEITPLHATTKVDLAITKASNITGTANVGDLIEFTVTAFNYGPCNASGVYVLEALDFNYLSYDYSYTATEGTTYDGYTWFIGYLDAGANATLKIVTRITEPGNFSNYVEIFGYDEDTNQSNNNASIDNITAVPVVDLVITKEVNVESDVVYYGDTVIFTVTVVNKGPSDATNVNVTEKLSPILEMIEYSTWDSYYDVDEGVWYIGDLARYDWRQLVIVTQVIETGNFTNVVCVTSTENDTNMSNNNASIPNITAKPVVDLAVTKDVNVTSGFVNVTDFIKYTVTVINYGPYDGTNVNVTEVLSPYLKFIDYEADLGYYNVTGGYWYIGDLANGTNVTLTIYAQVIKNGTFIPNLVIVSGSEKDPDPSNNWDEVIIAALPIVDLRITKEVNVTSSVVSVTDFIKFTVTVKNNGPCDATGVYVTESLSDRLKLISNTTTAGEWDGYTWNIGKLSNGANATLTIIAQVIYAGNITNAVTVSGFENETNYTDNNASIPNVTAVSFVDLAITKTVNVTTSEVNVTDIIRFTVTVTNNGPCNATGVYVSETLSPLLKMLSYKASTGEWDGTTWIIGNLTKGDIETLIITAEIIAPGNITNVVAVFGNENDTNTSNNNASIPNITAIEAVDLEITKRANVGSTVNVGDSIIFTVTVRNNGPCDATNVNVTEVLSPLLEMVNCFTWDSYYDVDAGVWYIGNLAKNDWRQLVIVAKVLAAGNISNVVCVTSTENDTNPDNNNASIPNITAVNAVDLYITKTVNVKGAVNVTDIIEFDIVVYNAGPCDATNVNVTEVLSPHLKYLSSITENGYYDVGAGVWYIGNLTNQSRAYLTIFAQVISNGTISNVVVVNSSENEIDNTTNRDEIDNITAYSIVDLSIQKTVNVTNVNVSDYIRYTIEIANAGPCNATDVVVYDRLSGLLEFVSFESTRKGITYDASTGKVTVGDLKVGESAVMTIIAKVIANGTVENTANITSPEIDTNKTNNNATSDNVTAHPIVDLEINKTYETASSTNVVNIGEVITYTVSVHNYGPSDATQVVVNEKLSDLVSAVSIEATSGYYDPAMGIWNIGTLAKGETATLTIRVKVISNGTIENVVSVTSLENDTDPYNNNASSDNITATDDVVLYIDKTVNVTDVNVGDYIQYQINVTNYALFNATDVYVIDKLDQLLEFISFDASRGDITYDPVAGKFTIGRLNADESVVITITAKVIGNGTIENTASVKSNETKTNNASSDNVTAHPIVDLSINKTVSTTEAKIGDEITYIITVHNYGPSDATGVKVSEKLSEYVSLIEAIPTRGSYDEGTGIWYIGNVADNETLTLTLIVKISAVETIENFVSVSSNENDTNPYNNNYTSENVTVEKLDTPIVLIPEDITYGDDETITVILPQNATGTVNITVNGKEYTDIPINNGIAQISIPDLAGGNYSVTVTYGGDKTYVSNSTDGSFNVAKAVPIITIEVVDIWHGEIEVLNVTVNAPGTVNITVFGITIEAPLNHSVTTTDVLKAIEKGSYDGRATWNLIHLPVGRYPAFAIYNGNENYTSVNISDVFYVRDKPSTVVVTADDIYVGEDAIVNVQVGPRGVTGNVTLVVDGVTYELNITEDGKASVTVSGLPVGLKDVYVRYNGDVLYRPSENTTTFNVVKYTPTMDIDAPDITVGDDGVITVTVPVDATGTITIEVDGRTYTQEIVNGTAVFVVPGLKEGTHEIKAYYSGDDKYLPVNSTGSIRVNPVKGNSTIENDTVDVEVHYGVGLSRYATGNPIVALLIILFVIFSIPLRRFK